MGRVRDRTCVAIRARRAGRRTLHCAMEIVRRTLFTGGRSHSHTRRPQGSCRRGAGVAWGPPGSTVIRRVHINTRAWEVSVSHLWYICGRLPPPLPSRLDHLHGSTFSMSPQQGLQ